MIDEMLAFLKQWLHRPQSVWLRKAMFQIHLWTGIGLGLYVVLISVSGSAIVFRNEVYNDGAKPKMVAVQGQRLTQDQTQGQAESDYPGYGITYLFESKRPDQATEIWLEKRGSKHPARCSIRTPAQDIGRSVPSGSASSPGAPICIPICWPGRRDAS